MPRTYTSTVVAPAQIGLAVVIGAVSALILEAIDPGFWVFALVAFLVIVATGVYLGTVTLVVTPDRLEITQGRGRREPQLVRAGEIVERYADNLTWSQCFGIGEPVDVRTTRLTVRPGPTLCLRMADGEVIRVSTPDPQAALTLLGGTRKETTP